MAEYVVTADADDCNCGTYRVDESRTAAVCRSMMCGFENICAQFDARLALHRLSSARRGGAYLKSNYTGSCTTFGHDASTAPFIEGAANSTGTVMENGSAEDYEKRSRDIRRSRDSVKRAAISG